VCGVALVLRSLKAARRGAGCRRTACGRALRQFGGHHRRRSWLYIGLADRLGFLIVVPVCLVAVFRALRVNWRPSLAWAIGGTLLVHLAFYKLLRVPLPWGVFRPFY
jgi:integral membrane sensor domain MASE1